MIKQKYKSISFILKIISNYIDHLLSKTKKQKNYIDLEICET